MSDVFTLPIFKEPHCLIKFNNEGALAMNRKVLEQLELLDRALQVVSIVGQYRTGKSYILNRLAGTNKGFPIGSTTEAKTKGIWIWGRPHPIYKNRILLLMDTEGFGDVEKGDKNNDNWVFTLAVLLSSTLVYNVMGSFSENYIENLGHVTIMSKYIKTSASTQHEDDSDFDLFFPVFILTLRDFTLELKKDGRDLTPDGILEEVCLKLREGKSERQRGYNESRLCIRKYFKTRKCFTFDRPGDRDELKMLEDLSDSELSKNFCDDSKTLADFVFRDCPLKMLENGRAVKGRMFAQMVRNYVHEIRNGGVPCIETAMSVTMQNENKLAAENCVEIYKQEMEKSIRLPTPDDLTLVNAHIKSLLEAMTNFLEHSFFDTDGRYQEEATAKIQEAYALCTRNNERRSAICCKNALQDLYATIQKKLEKNEYFRPGGYKEYMADIRELRDKYALLEGLGCKKDKVLLEFLEYKDSERQKVQKADRMITDREKEDEGWRKTDLSAERVIVNTKCNVQRKEQPEDVSRQVETNLKKFEDKIRIEVNNKIEHYETILRKREAELRRLQDENFQRGEKDLQKEIHSLNKRIDHMKEHQKNQSKQLKNYVKFQIEQFDTESKMAKESSCCII